MNCCLVLALALLTLSQDHHIASATNGETGGEDNTAKEGSPQYIYMERLRKNRTMADGADPTGEDVKTTGTLLATSFKDTFLNGGRIGSGGVSSSIDLHFTVPRQSANGISSEDDSKPISKSELWLFPSFDSPRDDRWYAITLGFVFTLEGFNRPVETEVNVLWRGSDECIMVDLTGQTKIIDRKLRKRNLNETLVHVKVTVHHKEEYHGSTPQIQEWQRTCSALSQRTSNTSFLVVKYFTAKEDTSDETRKKRSTAESSIQSNSSLPESGCSIKTYRINLREVLGDWVASPSDEVELGVCAGACNVEENKGLFSQQAILKDRLRNNDLLHNPNSYNFDVHCIALKVKPMTILIDMNKIESYVLFNLPIQAHTCGCR